ncbi:MAG: alpha/beta hydrolase [Hyphomicrobiaceae bacterium]
MATTRALGSPGNPDAFTSKRSSNINYADVTISIPTRHVAGKIEWPDTYPADPSRHFITTDRSFIDQSAFLADIRAQARAGGPQARNVLVFTHGYNTTHQEAVYWLAQIVHDANFQGTAVLFSWPSYGAAPYYVGDREAANYSRDFFERLLLQIASIPEVGEINILAHSMGCWLTSETLRQAKLKGHGHFGGKLGEVILAAPDLDIDVFRSQLDVIGQLPRPMTLLVSRDDKALALSKTIAGGVERAGMVTVSDPRVVAAAEHYNLRIVDLTNVTVAGNESSNHSKYSESGPVMAAIGNALQGRPGSQPHGVVTAVTNVGKSILQVPVAVVGAAASGN